MPTKIFTFNIPEDFIIPPEIEVSSGARLALVDNPGQDFVQDFNSPVGFIFDPALVDFSGSEIKQIDQRPVGATFGVTYTTDVNGNWGGGVLTGTPSGDPVITDGKLDLTPGGKFVRYPAAGNADSQQTGCIRFLFTPEYSGAPATNQTLFSIHETFLGVNNLIFLTHTTARRFNLTVYNSVGAAIISAVDLGIWSQNQSQEYEIEFNWDIDTGATRLFIDGNQHGPTQTATGTRSGSINYLTIGAAYNTGNTVNGLFDSLVIFDTVQHAANYTPGYTVPETIYPEADIVLPEMEYTGAGALVSFDSFPFIKSGNANITLQIGRSGNYLYWTGASWAVSDGSIPQTTSFETFAANVGTLPVAGEIYGKFKIKFLPMNSLSSVQEITASLTAQGYSTSNPMLTIIERTSMEALINFFIQAIITGLDNITFVLVKGTAPVWFDGIEWTESNLTYPESNTFLEIFDNRETLFEQFEIKSVQINIFFHSEDGTTTPEITELSIEYDHGGIVETVHKTIVWGYLFEFDPTPDTTPITIQLSEKASTYKSTAQITGNPIYITPRDNGYWEVELVDTDNMNEDVKYIFIIGGKKYIKSVPELDEVNFNELV